VTTKSNQRQCPACGAPAEGNVSPSGVCLSCGHDFLATAPPPGWKQAGLDLRAVARVQRLLLRFVLVIAILYVVNVALAMGARRASEWPTLALGAVILCAQIGALVMVVRLLATLRRAIIVRVIYAVLLVVPCLGLLALLSVSDEATRVLKFAGLKVGLMGVSDEQVVRMLAQNRCRACGYNLAGSATGTCPECGAAQAS
jgi:hypothetical protein